MYIIQDVYLLPELLYLIDDLPGYPLIHHLLGGGHVEENKEVTISVGVVPGREGGVNRVRDLNE
jgi:hypothetical protein